MGSRGIGLGGGLAIQGVGWGGGLGGGGVALSTPEIENLFTVYIYVHVLVHMLVFVLHRLLRM